jgi:hypothetical protein
MDQWRKDHRDRRELGPCSAGVYVDSRSRTSVGLGHLLGAKIVEFKQPEVA